jgi:hypothetical protein
MNANELNEENSDEELLYNPPVWDDPALVALEQERFKVTAEMKQDI